MGRATGESHSSRRAAVFAVAGVLLITAGCGGSDKSSSSGSSDTTIASTATSNAQTDAEVLGPKNVATGTPIKVGTVSDGRSPAFDNTMQLRTADAITKYLNEHRGGIAGHPIELVKCETGADPGKATDCANQLVRANVVLTVTGETTASETLYRTMRDAKIPLFVYGSGDKDFLMDTTMAFGLASPTAGLVDLPISVAKDNKLTKINAVVVDIPAATGFYQSAGGLLFGGMKLEVTAIPLGQADMTPQMTKIAAGGPSVVHIIGNDAFCIAAMNGLKAAAFKGAIDTINACFNETVVKAVGSYLKGVTLGSSSPVADPNDPGRRLLQAIANTYGSDINVDSALAANVFSVYVGARNALEGMTGAVTPAGIIAAFKAMPEMDIPYGGGLKFRCNGKAFPLTPAVCGRGILTTKLTDKGQPTLPYKVVGATPIPG